MDASRLPPANKVGAPPANVFALVLMRVDILVVIGAGIASSIPLCLAVQDMAAADVVRTAILGYVAPLPQVRALSGGGLVSMLDAVQIVCINSAYAGIFKETPLLAGIDRVVRRMLRRLSPYGGYAGDVCVYGDYFLQPDVGHHAGAPAVQRS